MIKQKRRAFLPLCVTFKWHFNAAATKHRDIKIFISKNNGKINGQWHRSKWHLNKSPDGEKHRARQKLEIQFGVSESSVLCFTEKWAGGRSPAASQGRRSCDRTNTEISLEDIQVVPPEEAQNVLRQVKGIICMNTALKCLKCFRQFSNSEKSVNFTRSAEGKSTK